MPKCTFRERPGDQELCTTLPEPGKDLCPRHEFLTALKAQQKDSREQAKPSSATAPPRTRADLVKRGFVFLNPGECSGCGQKLHWFRTPNGKPAPYNVMANDTAKAISHFATCTRSNDFRRSA